MDSLALKYISSTRLSLCWGPLGVWRKDRPWFQVASIIAGASLPMIVLVVTLGFLDVFYFREAVLNLGSILATFISCVSLAGAVVIWLKTRSIVGAMNLMVACVCSAVSLVMVHTSSGYSVNEGLAAVYLGSFGCGVLALICFAPSFIRQLPAALASCGGSGRPELV